MSGTLSFLVQSAQAARTQEESRHLSSSEPGREAVSLVLRRIGPFDKRISVADELRRAGLSLRASHAAITALAERDVTVVLLPAEPDAAFFKTLGTLDVAARTAAPPPDVDVSEVRRRTGMTQIQFARYAGIDVKTLQNWEQGRNAPEGAARNFLIVLDAFPELVESALFTRPREA